MEDDEKPPVTALVVIPVNDAKPALEGELMPLAWEPASALDELVSHAELVMRLFEVDEAGPDFLAPLS